MQNRVVRKRNWTLLVAALVAFLAGGAVFKVAPAAKLLMARDTNPGSPEVSFSTGFAPVAKPALPAVVNISSSKTVRIRQNVPLPPFWDDPFFRQFFGEDFGRGRQAPREQREHSLGSGVIVSPDGYLLTNNHVVESASEIRVFLSDRREFKAKVVGTDPKTDVAVLKINATDLAVLPLGDSSKLQVGAFVLAIGDPFGVGETVTMGIVSATGRSGLDINPQSYEDFIQTDAAINPGNSGGGLINVRGELIGINTAILTNRGGGNQGIGFAIPINMARGVMQQILKTGRVVRSYLGATIEQMNPALAKFFGLPSVKGVLISGVTPDGPAARAGIERGDVVLSMDGEEVNDINAFRLRIAQTPPGTTVRLKVFRNGSEREISVKLAELPEVAPKTGESESPRGALAGVQVDEVTSAVARQLGLPPTTRGVVVTDVRPDSPAVDAGLQPGDVIQEVNRRPISNVRGFERALREAGSGPVLLLVNRGGTTTYLAIQP